MMVIAVYGLTAIAVYMDHLRVGGDIISVGGT